MSPLVFPVLIGLSRIIPSVAKLMERKDNATVAKHIVDIAQSLTQGANAPEILAALEKNTELRMKFEESLSQLDLSSEKAYLEDRDNARKRDIAVIQTGQSNIRADIMVVSAAMGLASCLLILVFFQESMPGEAIGIISTIAGIFGSCLKDAYAFEFGSSRGSKNKDEHVATLLRRFDGEK